MTPEELKNRTKRYGLRVIRLVESLPKQRTAEVIGRQLLRCGTSVGANYRAAYRSRTDGDFLARMGIVEEEVDETLYWMEILVEANLVKESLLRDLMVEGEEILRIMVASINTTRSRVKGSAKIRNPKSEIRNKNERTNAEL